MNSFINQILEDYKKVNKKELPELLHHYTKSEGLLGIIDSNKIWASNIQYFNDKDEFKRTLYLLRKEVLNLFKSSHDPEMRDVYISYFDRSKILNKIDIYVISFSEKEDSLGQWRGYCPNYGFSIGFSYIGLKNLLKENDSGNYYLLPCFYDIAFHKKSINRLLKDDLNNLLSLYPSNNSPGGINTNNKKIYDEITDKVTILASIFKHESFSEEMEWRLICIRKKHYQETDIKYRKGNSLIIPYIEFPIESKSRSLPIKEIIIGPTPMKDLSRKSIKMLLNSKNIKCKRVINSNIPFRNW